MDAKLDQTHATRRIVSAAKYEGVLAEPLPKPSANSSADERAAWQARRDQKEVLLMRHHGVDPTAPDAKAELLTALEECHVPGLRHKSPKQGRPCERAGGDLLYWQLLEFEKRRCLHSERRVSEMIASLRIVKGSAETLRTRHIKWKRKGENQIKVWWADWIAKTEGETVVINLFRRWLGDNSRRLDEERLLIASQKVGPVRVIPPNGEWTWGARKSRSRG